MYRFRRLILLAGVLLGLPSYAFAVNIVTLPGTDVEFTLDLDALGLFGNTGLLNGGAIVVGNSLFFQPDSFIAESLNGAGAVLSSENLGITVTATTPGYVITSLAMAEQGDYIQSGIDASVTASMRLGAASTTKSCASTFPLPCSDESIVNLGPFTDTGGATVNWSGSTSVDLTDTADWGSDTEITVSFQNNLSATTLNAGEIARIEKKLGAVGLVVNPIPVPAAVWLFGSGLLGLVGIARRKKSA